MATNNYSISFKSLRTNSVYTLNIGGGSGTAIALKGGAQPFTTEENDDEDQFCPIRTQTGHIRIVDDGKDANGNALSADWWKDLAPINDTERPVTLTGVDANGNSLGTLWQGFMQAQNFGGTQSPRAGVPRAVHHLRVGCEEGERQRGKAVQLRLSVAVYFQYPAIRLAPDILRHPGRCARPAVAPEAARLEQLPARG